MKNTIKITVLLIIVALVCAVFVACEPDEENQQTFILTFETNGGNEIDLIENNGTDDIELPSPQREGYTFNGWYIDNDTFENEYTGQPLSQDTTVYADWSVNEYTITFESNGGSSVESINANYNEEITAPNSPQKEGYTFEGWFVDSDLQSEFLFDTMPPQDITVYAKWDLIEYNITYQLDGGENNQNNPQTYTIETQSFELMSASSENKVFLGWFSDAGFDTEITHIGGGETGDITLFAKWIDGEIVDGLVLSFNSSDNSYTVTGGEAQNDLVIPAEYNGYPITMIGNQAFEGNDTIETVSIPMSIIYIGEEAFSNCSNLTDIVFDESMVFEGWYSDSDLQNEFIFDGSMLVDDMTLYAKWEGLQKGIKLQVAPQEFPGYPDQPNAWGYKFSIENIAFSEMLALGNYNGHPVSQIASNAFSYSAIQNINLPYTLMNLGAFAFKGCDSLEEIELPENLYFMGEGTFQQCSQLNAVYVERKIDWKVYNYNINMGAPNMFDGSFDFLASGVIYVYIYNGGIDFEANPGVENGYDVYTGHNGAFWYTYSFLIQPHPSGE